MKCWLVSHHMKWFRFWLGQSLCARHLLWKQDNFCWDILVHVPRESAPWKTLARCQWWPWWTSLPLVVAQGVQFGVWGVESLTKVCPWLTDIDFANTTTCQNKKELVALGEKFLHLSRNLALNALLLECWTNVENVRHIHCPPPETIHCHSGSWCDTGAIHQHCWCVLYLGVFWIVKSISRAREWCALPFAQLHWIEALGPDQAGSCVGPRNIHYASLL